MKENTDGFLTVPEPNFKEFGSWYMVKNTETNHNAVRHPEKQQMYVIISGGCGQACLGMPKIMPNTESASPQDWVEL